MRSLVWGRTFIRAYKRAARKHPELEGSIRDTLRALVEDPFHPLLETHKLKGKLDGSWACSVGYDLRIVFDFCPTGKGGGKDILLIDIGTHDEVY